MSVPMVQVGDFNLPKDGRDKLKKQLELKNKPAEETTLWYGFKFFKNNAPNQ